MRLSYIRLLVRDFDRCFDFYSEIMGFDITWGEKGEDYASFQVNEKTMLSLYKQELMMQHLGLAESVEVQNDYRMTIVFDSENVDDEYQRLRELNASFLNEPHDVPGWGSRCFHIVDPEGNLIEINQVLPKDKWEDELKNHQDASRY